MIAFVAALVTLAPAVTVSGTVTAGGKPLKDAVVWLEGGAEPKGINASVEQKGKRFNPHVLVVPVGSTVDFPNRDDLFHNVFAEYNAKKFDLGMYPKGQTRKVTFDKPGMVSVLCNVHSNMSAFVMVVDSAYYAKTDSKGKFAIDRVPAGSYELEGWHESGKRAAQHLSVGPANAVVSIRLERG
jgi:plastocyanin